MLCDAGQDPPPRGDGPPTGASKASPDWTMQLVWRSPNRRRCCGVPVIGPAESRLAVIRFRSEASRSRLRCLTPRNAAYLSTGHHNFRVAQSLGADERK
jgi:hypothetical protein